MSAIVVTWNRKAELLRCLDSLWAQEWPALEVLVVDNGSRDGTVDALRGLDKPVTILCNRRNLGASVGRNQALARARGKYVLFLDSDAYLLTPGGLRRLVEFMESPDHGRVAAVAGPIYSNAERTEVWLWGGRHDAHGYLDLVASKLPLAEQGPCASEVFVSTCFSLWRTKVVRQAGGFDPFYFYMYEDIDLCRRAMQHGWIFSILSDVSIHHHYAPRGRVKLGYTGLLWQQEWRRQHYLLKNYGWRYWWWSVRQGSRPLAFQVDQFQGPEIGWWRWPLLFVLLPAGLGALGPWICARRRRDFISSSPPPAEIHNPRQSLSA